MRLFWSLLVTVTSFYEWVVNDWVSYIPWLREYLRMCEEHLSCPRTRKLKPQYFKHDALT